MHAFPHHSFTNRASTRLDFAMIILNWQRRIVINDNDVINVINDYSMPENFAAYRLVIDYPLIIGNNQRLIN